MYFGDDGAPIPGGNMSFGYCVHREKASWDMVILLNFGIFAAIVLVFIGLGCAVQLYFKKKRRQSKKADLVDSSASSASALYQSSAY